MSSWRALDRTVAGVALVLLAALALVLWRGDRVSVTIVRTAPAAGSQAATTAPIVIEFGQRMNAASVEQNFSIEPAVEGKFVWSDNTVYFMPSQLLELGAQYTVTLAQGAQGQIAHELLEDLSFSFEVRPPGVAFLRLEPSGYSLWAMPALDDAEPVQLSPGDGVFDFTVASDGEMLIFSVVNDEAGIDLWTVGREGGDARILLDCGVDRCFGPSERAGRLAYTRVLAPMTPAEPYGPPRVWLYDPKSGSTVRLHADSQKIGFGPSWSPDGQRLAYFDGGNGRLVVLDMRTGDEVHIPTMAGVVGSWAPSGEYMLFFDTLLIDGRPVNQVYRANFATQDVLPFFDPQPLDADYSGPVVSPNGEWVALKVRDLENLASEQLWILPADGAYAMVAVEESGYLYSKYLWRSDSQALLYHRLTLGSAESAPSVWLWERSRNASRLLAEDANQPLWLP
ncbi:MAG: Ig-like domain-containing protein [Anaerolineales bacterium]|nr:MAG: Ig-like domain-containing protein [Anaerolineales bacterium]